MNLEPRIKALRKELDLLYQLESSMAVLGYDQQVLMPAAAATGRARQLESISTIHHERLSSDYLWNLVLELKSEFNQLDSDNQVIVRELHRNLERSRKLPVSFIAERSRLCAESFSAWCEAKPRDDWASVRPYLEKIIKLGRQEAELVGYQEHTYDALLDSYEPYCRLSYVKPLLLSVADRLKPAMSKLQEKYGNPASLEYRYPVQQQQELCKRVMRDFGFDFNSGRLDTAAHPFMSTLGPRDIRITTRYNEQSFLPALFGTIHECGHAFYEAGLPETFRGTPRGSAISMGIHESQSRLWENILARSRPFISYVASIVPEYFGFKLDENIIWSNANTVKCSLIRVEADEVSYTLHIVIRMLLEERLISGELNVADAPQAWNQLYRDYLGLEVPGYSMGIMQDVHWYGGSIGYFPSYALGNLYGAIFMEHFEAENGTLSALIENRSFSLLKEWLAERIYTLGQSLSAQDLVKKISGKRLGSEAFLNYLSKKFEISF